MLGGMETRYVGGLLVAEEGRTERQVQAELERLQHGLFLDKEYDTTTGRVFYTVKYLAGSGRPPDLILDWREENDTPKPLSTGIIGEVQRMMAQGPVTRAKLEELNRKAEARRRSDVDYGYQEIVRDFEKRDSSGHSAVLPRGASLRQSRDKARAAGRKV